MKPLKTYRFPTPKEDGTRLTLEFAKFRDNNLEEEIEKEKELRDNISEIESDLEKLGSEDPAKMDPEKAYNQLKFYDKKANSFIFRNTAGRLLPDSLDEIAGYTNISEKSISEAYRKRFEEEEISEEDAIGYLELQEQVENSQLIELRNDPLEDAEKAFEELERVKGHLEGVSDRMRETYREVADEIEGEFREYIDEHEKISENDVEWTSATSFTY